MIQFMFQNDILALVGKQSLGRKTGSSGKALAQMIEKKK